MANIFTNLNLIADSNFYITQKINSIGYVGENTVTRLNIEVPEITQGAVYELETENSAGEKNVALLSVNAENNTLYLDFTARMLTANDLIMMQLRITYTDDSIKKSNRFAMKIAKSISATDYYEEYTVTIFDQLVQECRDIIEGAESYAVRAETAAVNAEAYEQSASASASTASTASETAQTASTAAVNAATSAETSANTASTSAETATTAANSASTSASTAQTSAQTAQSASVTAQSASEAAQTASTAATSAQTAAETAANNASASATSASTSASNAATSETNASNSATAAATSETNAANSATSASTSATNAANSAVAAATSATNAHNSEVNASTSETNASTSATEAAASAESIAASVAQINENTYRINDLEAIIAGYQLADLPTGAIATVTDGTALLMPSLKIGIEPQQDLHGYDHPWVGGAGKNLFHVDSRVDATIADVRYTSDDEYLYLNGTKQGSGYANLTSLTITLQAGTYYIKALPISGSVSNVYIYPYDGNTNLTSNILTEEKEVTLDSEKTFYFRFGMFTDGIVLNNYKIGIVISKTANIDKFYPYSNICPISGWTAANVTRTGKNLYNIDAEYTIVNETYMYELYAKPNTAYTLSSNCPSSTPANLYFNGGSTETNGVSLNYPKTFNSDEDGKLTIYVRYKANVESIDLYTAVKNGQYYIQLEEGTTATTYEPYNGQTYTIEFKDGDNPLVIYGGTLDVVNGELTVTDAHIASYNAETLPSTWISDRDVYAEGTTPTTGAEVVYKLANSVTYQLSPTQVRTLVGNNNIWSDTGDIIEGKYFKSLV